MNATAMNTADMNATDMNAEDMNAAAAPVDQTANAPAPANNSSHGFPFGVLGLLGLIGLFGVRKARG
jgi:hypothetical protein